MNPALTIFKSVADIVVSTGAGAVVGNAIRMTTPADLSLYKKVSIGVGGFVLSSMAGTAAAKYTSEQIDSTVRSIQELRGKITQETPSETTD